LPTENLANEFAHDLAKVLERGRTDHRYDRLVLVADRKFLGRLRAAMTTETTRLVSATLDKDLSNVSDRDLPAHLSDILRTDSLPS
jgi:protein required for attachment to host cells